MTREPDTRGEEHSENTEPAAPAPASQPSEPADRLTARSTGRWLVRSQGSRHLIDLDAMTYQRLPGPGRARFAHDGHPVRLTRMNRWLRVGSTFLVWVDDPTRPDLLEHWHQSSTIVSITKRACPSSAEDE
jgi:hypothetical protein